MTIRVAPVPRASLIGLIVVALAAAALLIATPLLARPSHVARAVEPVQVGDGPASLNIRKEDDEGNRLAGAVFEVEGIQGTFTTADDGKFCLVGLEKDSTWVVTEIEAPPGFQIADPASQTVEVDDDGDCDSPDTTFINVLAAETPTPVPTPAGGQLGGTPTPVPTPRESTEAGAGGPGGGGLPNTATDPAQGSPVLVLSLLLLGSLGGLAGLRLARAPRRRR